MVVDDSAVARGIITRILESDPALSVVARASNGRMAIDTLEGTPVDVVVLDIEMPVMDGLTALPELIRTRPSAKIIIASTLTRKNAEISLRALAAGAADYVLKPSTIQGYDAASDFRTEFLSKVKALGAAARKRSQRAGHVRPPVTADVAEAEQAGLTLRPAPAVAPEVIAIGSSTGGPQALIAVLTELKGIRQPILITQHMPATFTAILAQHLGRATGVPCREAVDGEPVLGGRIYVAPGDYHMIVECPDGAAVIRLLQTPPENFCRPAVDPLLSSVSRVFGRKVLAVILTGMGSDGLTGARAVVDAGGVVVAQDEETSVVWGMPGAVARAGLCCAILPPADIGSYVHKLTAKTPS